MAYTWDEFPFTNTANFESVARTALEQWRLNCAAETAVDGFSGLEERADGAESRLTDVEAGTGITALDGSKIADASLSGDKLIEDTVEERHLEIGNGPTDNYLLSWNASVGILVWTAPGAAGTDTYQVKDDAADVTPGYLEDKVAKYLTRKNLLINPNMVVNQEGYVDGAAVSVDDNIYDMWSVYLIGYSPSISTSGEDITLTECAIVQANDDLIAASGGNDVTLTASVASGSVFFSDQIDESATITPSSPLTFTYNSSVQEKVLIGRVGDISTFSGLKLEVGSIATQYEIPQVTEEELKCYRYLLLTSPDMQFTGPAMSNPYTASGTTMIDTKFIGVAMSRDPIVSYTVVAVFDSVTSPSSSTFTAVILYNHSSMELTCTAVDTLSSGTVTMVSVYVSGMKLDARY